MIVSLIVAIEQNRGIGYQGEVPWKLSTDLKLFRKRTMGHYLIQGRKTYESIGRPLPGRNMVVVTRQTDYQAEGCSVVHSLSQALDLARSDGETEAFVSGGAGIYAEALPTANRIYLTRVLAEVETDVFFPEWGPNQWEVIEESEHPVGEKDQHPFIFQTLERK